jgi:hypothetical protein
MDEGNIIEEYEPGMDWVFKKYDWTCAFILAI